jgi:hypothetical protein
MLLVTSLYLELWVDAIVHESIVIIWNALYVGRILIFSEHTELS